jgi:hypothetical protein
MAQRERGKHQVKAAVPEGQAAPVPHDWGKRSRAGGEHAPGHVDRDDLARPGGERGRPGCSGARTQVEHPTAANGAACLRHQRSGQVRMELARARLPGAGRRAVRRAHVFS